MDNGRVGELQRVAQIQTLRTLQQPLVSLPMSADGRSDSSLSHSPAPSTPGAAAVRIPPRDAPAATVELSAAALLPPVLGEGAIERIRDTTARPLATVLVDLTRSLHDPSAATDERAAPALKLATQLRMLTEVIATAAHEQPTSPVVQSMASRQARNEYQRMQPIATSPVDEASSEAPSANATSLDPRITQVMLGAGLSAQSQDPRATGVLPHGTAAYMAAPGLAQTYARMDLIEVESDAAPGAPVLPSTLLATLHLQLPEFGQVIATVALTGLRADVSVAGSAGAIAALRDSEALARQSADAWGVKLGTLNFVEFG